MAGRVAHTSSHQHLAALDQRWNRPTKRLPNIGQAAAPEFQPMFQEELGAGFNVYRFVTWRARHGPIDSGSPDGLFKMPRFLEIEVVLRGVRPKVWRSFLLRADATFAYLHAAIQLACEWQDYHLYAFFEYTPKGVDWDRIIAEAPAAAGGDTYSDRPPRPSAHQVSLDSILSKAGDKCFYVYDYGDGWEHEITVLSAPLLTERLKRRLLGGERAFPLEDSGSIPGYEELVANFNTPPEKLDEEARHRQQWAREINPDWAPEKFELARVKASFDRPRQTQGGARTKKLRIATRHDVFPEPFFVNDPTSEIQPHAVAGVPLDQEPSIPTAEALPRYRERRNMQRELNARMIKSLPKDAIWKCAQSIGVPDESWLSSCEPNDLYMVADFAAHRHTWRGATALARLLLDLRPDTSPVEQEVRESLGNARFSMWMAHAPHPGIGVDLIDIIAVRRVFIVDEGLSQNTPNGTLFAARLMETGGYCMTTGCVLPVSPDTVLHVMLSIDPKFDPLDRRRKTYVLGRELEPELERLILARQLAENAGAFLASDAPKARRRTS
ncbi:MAG: plasmid pRiA4b ORF-3 family protein [Planctomycetes bacterium]|nr:plasmid pRiA4b ORF-3 family protein [Planctomycetota bacterium]